ncbi:HAD hydrolase family protein [Paenibacillus sp. XY044]
MKLLRIGREDVACIGDSFNDLAMFRISSRSLPCPMPTPM